jgi:hypothetical protein
VELVNTPMEFAVMGLIQQYTDGGCSIEVT